jgi:hypothetical protein
VDHWVDRVRRGAGGGRRSGWDGGVEGGRVEGVVSGGGRRGGWGVGERRGQLVSAYHTWLSWKKKTVQ